MADDLFRERLQSLEALRHALHRCEASLYRLPQFELRDCPPHYAHQPLREGREQLVRALIHYARLAELYGLELPVADLSLTLDGGASASPGPVGSIVDVLTTGARAGGLILAGRADELSSQECKLSAVALLLAGG